MLPVSALFINVAGYSPRNLASLPMVGKIAAPGLSLAMLEQPADFIPTPPPVEVLPSRPPIAPLQTITKMADFLALVSELTSSGSPLWFRGVRNAAYDLEPSLYRHPTTKGSNDLIELEWSLLSDFRHRAPPFSDRLPKEDLEMLFLMQHYGVPTRLLDWSESPLVSLFFALENARQSGGSDHDAAFWILDPVGLNSLAADHREGSNQIYGADADELGGYKPRPEAKRLKEILPSAMFGIHNSPRIVIQRGTFVIFGKDTTPMNRQAKIVSSNTLRRVDIAKDAKDKMFSELFSMGVSDSAIYPDLDGLGRELRNRRGF